MKRYIPDEKPNRLEKTAGEMHRDIDEMTDDGFDGITAKDGLVKSVIGELSDGDEDNVADYLGVRVEEANKK